MGRYGGRLKGLQARQAYDLAQSREDRAENQYAQGVRSSDRQYGLATERERRAGDQFAEQKRRSGVSEGLATRSEKRAESKYLDERQASRYSRAYQAASLGDTGNALMVYNEGIEPGKQIDDISVDENRNLVLSRRGSPATIPYDKLRRYLPKDSTDYLREQQKYGIGKVSPATRRRETAKGKYDLGLKIMGMSSRWTAGDGGEIKDDGELKKRVGAGLAAGVPEEQMARQFGLIPNKEMAKREARIGALGKKIEGHESALAKGDENWWFQSRRKLANKLKDEQAGLMDKQIVTQFQTYDTNQDNVIDELDADYNEAIKVTDYLAKNPDKRQAVLNRYGAQEVAEIEALVQAIKQRETVKAKRRVGLGK